MDLTTALGVKRDLEAFFTTRTRGSKRRKFALGVATPTATTDYRVAVRTPTAEDLPDTALDVIRRQTNGEMDVRVVGPIGALGAHTLAISRGVAIGASVAHYLCTAGTLGFFARRESDGAIGFVSNNHVIAAEDRGEENDDILHPAPADRGRRSDNVIGHLAGGYPRLKNSKVEADCAFARLVDGMPYDASSLENGQKIGVAPLAPYAEPDVCKIGRTTGLTYGRITAFDLGPEVHYGFGAVLFRKQIEIDSVNDLPFSLGGDSGSLVFTRSLQPVALVFAASAIGGRRNSGLTYANPIDSVLSALGVTLLT
jgi:hypothetical protein